MAFSVLIHLLIFAALLRLETGAVRSDGVERKNGGERIGRQARNLFSEPGPGDANRAKGSRALANRIEHKAENKRTPLQGRLEVKGRSGAGFSVLARRRGSDAVVAQARLNASGNFVLPLLRPGSYELSLVHEGRVLSRLLIEIQAGAALGLEWRRDLSARRIPAGADVAVGQLTPIQFWEMVRAPSSREWRRNLEAMLSKAGVSVAALQARRRAENQWLQLLELGHNLDRRWVYITESVGRWLGSAGIVGSVN